MCTIGLYKIPYSRLSIPFFSPINGCNSRLLFISYLYLYFSLFIFLFFTNFIELESFKNILSYVRREYQTHFRLLYYGEVVHVWIGQCFMRNRSILAGAELQSILLFYCDIYDSKDETHFVTNHCTSFQRLFII